MNRIIPVFLALAMACTMVLTGSGNESPEQFAAEITRQVAETASGEDAADPALTAEAQQAAIGTQNGVAAANRRAWLAGISSTVWLLLILLSLVLLGAGF